MNLEDLVPPLELCRKIPFPKFEDSVFVRHIKNGWILERTNIDLEDEEAGYYVPAPTLQEILDALSEIGEPVTLTQWKTGQIAVSCQIGDDSFEEVSQNGAEAALKLWLEVNKTDKSNKTYEIEKEE